VDFGHGKHVRSIGVLGLLQGGENTRHSRLQKLAGRLVERLHIPTLRKAPPELGGGLRELRSIWESAGCTTEDARGAMMRSWLPTLDYSVERLLPMLVRITQHSEDSLTVITIDGSLEREGVAELERLRQGVPSRLALDLTYLWWVDAAGITLLNTLADTGAQLRGVSPYIALLLGRSEA
jgi:ABC-type transporter Mla MlaB component